MGPDVSISFHWFCFLLSLGLGSAPPASLLDIRGLLIGDGTSGGIVGRKEAK